MAKRKESKLKRLKTSKITSKLFSKSFISLLCIRLHAFRQSIMEPKSRFAVFLFMIVAGDSIIFALSYSI